MWNGVYEKTSYNRFLTRKISHQIRMGQHKEDPVASANFGHETVYNGADKDSWI